MVFLRSSLALALALVAAAPATAFSPRAAVRGHQLSSRRAGRCGVIRMVASGPTRVVVTGLGPVNGVGMNQEEFFAGLLEGQSSLGDITRFDVSPDIFTCKIGSQVPDSF